VVALLVILAPSGTIVQRLAAGTGRPGSRCEISLVVETLNIAARHVYQGNVEIPAEGRDTWSLLRR
jgi:hypothetical protein